MFDTSIFDQTVPVGQAATVGTVACVATGLLIYLFSSWRAHKDKIKVIEVKNYAQMAVSQKNDRIPLVREGLYELSIPGFNGIVYVDESLLVKNIICYDGPSIAYAEQLLGSRLIDVRGRPIRISYEKDLVVKREGQQ